MCPGSLKGPRLKRNAVEAIIKKFVPIDRGFSNNEVLTEDSTKIFDSTDPIKDKKKLEKLVQMGDGAI
uniref:Uncharacterized protein n=1 Tax=Steinernema glaseri TaxID=37863 RepID=A0A1I7Z494_9BILA